MTNYLEISHLHTKTEKTLGPRFDLKKFHDRVLENNSVPLPVLHKRIEE